MRILFNRGPKNTLAQAFLLAIVFLVLLPFVLMLAIPAAFAAEAGSCQVTKSTRLAADGSRYIVWQCTSDASGDVSDVGVAGPVDGMIMGLEITVAAGVSSCNLSFIADKTGTASDVPIFAYTSLDTNDPDNASLHFVPKNAAGDRISLSGATIKPLIASLGNAKTITIKMILR